ncbi:MAG: cobalamin B12-binding domain-containing protein [Myxococcota bacterium]
MPTRTRFAAALLRATSSAYAAGAVERLLERDPALAERHAEGFTGLTADLQERIDQLAVALHFGREQLFLDHVAWLKVATRCRGRDLSLVVGGLEALRDEVDDRLPADAKGAVVELIDHALAYLPEAPAELPSLLEEPSPHALVTRRYMLAVLEGRRDDAIDEVLRAAESGVESDELYREVLVRAQAEIGRMWQCGEVHVGEEHFATRVAHEVLTRLRRRDAASCTRDRRILLSTVSGDLHDLGARMLEQRFEAAGYQTILLGASTPAIDLARAALDFEAHMVAISAHLPDQVRAVEELVGLLKSEPELADRPILVGGPPFEQVPDLWSQIGADAWAASPAEAVEVAERLFAAS